MKKYDPILTQDDLSAVLGTHNALTVYLAPHQVIQYCPNHEAYIWLRSARNITFWTYGVLGLVTVVNGFTGFLSPFMMFLGVVFLKPLKPLLIATDPAQAFLGGFIDLFSTIATVFFLILGFFVARWSIRASERATHLAINHDGISVARHNISDRYFIKKRFRWVEIDKITVDRPEGKRSAKDYVIHLNSNTGGEIFSFRYGDVYDPEERNFFLRTIESNVSGFDPEVFEVLKPPPDRQSYTELWLRELSAPPKRDKLTPLSPGAMVNNSKYRVIAKIGVGGQGTVYLAQPTAGQEGEVVLKEFVLPIYPDPRVRQQAAEKFQLEAEMLSKLDNPKIVRFFDLFIEDHRAYLVLERIEGNTLKDLVVNEGHQPESYVVDLALQMCEILEYLHGMAPPIVHRDFTPDNLILEPDGNLKLVDFSVAQKMESTMTGSVVGKPSYIAPEQFRGKPTTQSDIYSLGATLYYLLVGEDPPPITRLHPESVNEKVSMALNTVIARATHLDPEKRYADVETMRADLAKIRTS